MQLQFKPFEDLADLFPAALQVGSVVADQDEVVHISDVIFDSQPFLDVVIHIVKERYAYYLYDLTISSLVYAGGGVRPRLMD